MYWPRQPQNASLSAVVHLTSETSSNMLSVKIVFDPSIAVSGHRAIAENFIHGLGWSINALEHAGTYYNTRYREIRSGLLYYAALVALQG